MPIRIVLADDHVLVRQGLKSLLEREKFQVVAEAYRSKSDRPVDPLTVRERQVLQLIAEGKSTKDTASLLGISVKTAESHRMRLMQKLDIHETASLVRYAVRRGLVEP